MDDEKKQSHSVGSFAFRFSLGTLLSRITGMMREQITAFFFGTSPFIAAFLIAYRFALMLRRLLGEGSLLTGFIPRFETLRLASEEKAAHFFREVHAALSWFLLLLVMVLEGGLFCLWKAHLFSSNNQEILLMMMMILPSLFFICLYALYSALLQCQKRFFLPALAPAVFNVIWSGAVCWWGVEQNSYLVLGLSLSTILAFVFQWMILIPSTHLFLRPFFSWNRLFQATFDSREFRALFKNVSLTALGLGASQINGFFDTLFARAASLEGPAYLNYAMRLYQLPLALIGVAISSALLPSLSRAFREENPHHFRELLQFGMQKVFIFIVPATFAIIALGLSSVIVIYFRGCFHEGSVFFTTLCLWGLSLGLLPATLCLLLNQGFYATQEYKIPTRGALYTVLLNFLLNILFVGIAQRGPEWVTLSTSLASMFNLWYLWRHLIKKTGSLISFGMRRTFGKIFLTSSFAAFFTLLIGKIGGMDFSLPLFFQQKEMHLATTLPQQLGHFFSLFGIFVVLFLGGSYCLKIEEIFHLLRWKKKRASITE